MKKYSYLKKVIPFLLFIFHIPLLSQNYLVPPSPMSIAVGDFDLDNDLDIVTGHNPYDYTGWGGVYFLENLSDGSFIVMDSIYLYGGQTSLDVGFINNDNNPDILSKHEDPLEEIEYAAIVTDFDQDSIQHYSYNTYEGIRFSRLLDYDGDGDQDIAFVYDYWEDGKPYGAVGLLTNLGNGVFSDPKKYSVPYPNGFAVGDLNNDNCDDAVESGLALRLLFGSDSGFTTKVFEGSWGHRMDINDMNNDGWNDIVAMEWNGPGQDKDIYIYYNLGNGNFHADSSNIITVTQGGSHIYAGDLNNDNYGDIVFNSAIFYPNGPHDTDSTYVILNNGNGSFSKVKGYYTGIYSEKSAIADLDGDGFNDILTTSHAHSIIPHKGIVHLLFNDGTGHFYEKNTTIDEPNPALPEDFLLFAYPNPFNSKVNISYELPSLPMPNSFIEIFNIIGQKIKKVDIDKKSGMIKINFNGLPSGQYLVNLKTGNQIKNSIKITYIK